MTMKTTIRHTRREEASVLAVGLVICVILSLSLLSYLSLVNSQNTSVARGQAWNAALAMAEAGAEEALAQLNPSVGATNILAANGWNIVDGNYQPTPARRDLAGGYYYVSYTPTPPPTIYSTGYVTIPAVSATVQRAVEVRTTNAPAFDSAMAAKLDIDFKGFMINIDSYDSANELYSTAGKYDAAKRKAGGDVASTAGLVNVQNAHVKGKLFTGPTGSYNLGIGEVGGLSWTGPGIQPGWYRNDYNVEFPDVPVPFTAAVAPGSRTITNETFKYYLGSGNYMVSGDVVLNNTDDSHAIYVAGYARLYVTGNFSMSGNRSFIYVAPGAKLELYVGGASANFTKVNVNGNAYAFQYYGLPGNTSVTWGGNDEYIGTVYAPQATFTLGGGGNDEYDYQGSCVANSIKLNGKFNFHYDEDLKRNGPPRGYVAISWREL